jgi:hypothetical protein
MDSQKIVNSQRNTEQKKRATLEVSQYPIFRAIVIKTGW